MGTYRNYPRIVGETGGKNFVLAHPSADSTALTAAIIRGAFEYQGQKCSAASRLFIPRSLWPALRERLVAEIATIRVGDVADFRNFMGAVIDDKAWRKHAAAIEEARTQADCEIVAGGKTSKETGYFVDPTVIVTSNFDSRLLRDELFGPIATAFVYEDRDQRQGGLHLEPDPLGVTACDQGDTRCAARLSLSVPGRLRRFAGRAMLWRP